MRTTSLLVLCFILFSQLLTAQLIHIPADYENIQDGIDAASPGDTVLVSPGEYFENLNMKGKNIVLCSQYALSFDPADLLNTIINGSIPSHPDTASCILIVTGETSDCIVQGFTITGGMGTVWEDEHGPGNFYREGGGILIQFAAPTIKNNRFIGNEATNNQGVVSAGGGAIRCGDGNPSILNNTFLYNLARYGAGIVLNYSDATINNNLIAYNSGGQDYGGAGIWSVSNGDDPVVIENNTILFNHSEQVGGGIRLWSCIASVTNNIIWGNTALNYGQVAGGNNLTYNCIQNGFAGEGNIDIPPAFDDSNYLLSDNSPCIDAGHPDPGYNDPEDPDNPGFAEYPSKGTLQNDMGVYGGALSMVMTSLMTGQIQHDLKEGRGVSVFPNPTKNNIYVSLDEFGNSPTSIQLYDVNLKLLQKFKWHSSTEQSNTFKLNLNDLPSGCYFLKIAFGDHLESKKIIKH